MKLKIKDFDKKFKKFINGVANDLKTELIISCPVDKGDLRQSIDSEVKGNKITVTMHEYGLFVDQGTKPHIIKPKNKKALHWGGKDGPVVKSVKHPGTQPNPFIRNSLDRLPKLIKSNMRHFG